MTQLAATVKSYENHEDGFKAVVSIEVTEKFRLVQLDHGIIGALSENLVHVEQRTHEVRLEATENALFTLANRLAPRA